MAILKAQVESSNGFEITELPPAGDYVATCLDIQDEFGVTRRKFQSEETEEQDVTRFLFGFQGQDQELYKVQSWEMKISGSPKSKLFKFLSDWLGKAPSMGWDYCELKGKGAVIKVEHKQSQMGKVYAFISSINPPKNSLNDYTSQVIPAEKFSQASQPAPQVQVSSNPPAWSPEDGDDNCPF
jgi:hypothetical protein